LENVRGLLTANQGEALRQVFAAVADHGYDAWWTCVRASDVGAPHRRERWFCLAADAEGVGCERGGSSRDGWTRPADGHLGTVEWGPYDAAIHRWEHVLGTTAPVPVINGKQLNPALVEWMMGFPTGWVTDLDLTRTQMLKCLGNAVVPQQAAYAVTELLRLAADEEPVGPQADEVTLLPTPTANQPGGTW
jgi:DNA (cytosine-5)-methyltransferase 1